MTLLQGHATRGRTWREHGVTRDREWKGAALYWSARVGEGAGERRASDVAWSYPRPDPPFEALAGHFAFVAGRVDACYVGPDRVTPQPGGFYGGWVTPNVLGPFKGEPGTEAW